MPTKPTEEFEWGTSMINESAITAAHGNDGFPNGETPSSTEFNNVFRVTGEHTMWILGGTSTAAETAHIVETDASGIVRPARMIAGTPSTANPAITCTGGSTAAGISATGGATSGSGVLGAGTGSGHGVDATGGATGSGVVGTCGATGSAGTAGIVGVGTVARPGVLGNAAPASGAAGVEGVASATGPGVLGTGGSTGGPGVLGAAGSINAFGVQGTSHATASNTGAGVRGGATGDGTGVAGMSTDGYAVSAFADITSPVRSAFRMVPQDTDPTSRADGDMWMQSTTEELRYEINGRSMAAWCTEDGFCHASATAGTGANNDSATWTTISTATFASPNDPKHVGTIILQASAEFGSTGGTLHTTFDVRIYDNTSAATVFSRTLQNPNAVATSYDRPWSVQSSYTLPATGVRTFLLQFRRTGAGGTGVSARDASLTVRGVY